VGTPEWSNTTVLRGDLAQQVGRLPERHGGPIVVHGSPTLVQGLLEHDLLDELRLMVYPVILGKGRRLFGSTTKQKRMRLRSSKLVGDGVEILIYEAVRSA
jgi:dihydrofolate reductase